MINKEIKKLLTEAKKTNELVIKDFEITSEIWNEVFKLTNLEMLVMVNNQIKVLPKEIGKLTNLDTLVFSNNQIKVLPKEIGKLTNLDTFGFSNNQIKVLPKEIGKLTNLDTFGFSNNQIKVLPKEIEKLTNLTFLDFSANPISTPKSFKITNFKLLEQLELFDLSENINLIIGKNGTGKTSLLQALTFALINEKNEDIDTRTLKSYITKETEKQEENIFQIKKTEEQKAIIETIYSDNISKKIEISHLIKRNFVHNSDLLLSYGSNFFHKTQVIDNKLLDNLISGNGNTYSIYSIFEDYTDKFTDPSLILYRFVDFAKKNKKLEPIFNILINTLNEFLGIQEVEKFVIEQNKTGYFYYKNKKTNKKFILSELSEGYRTNILLVSDILIRILSARNKFFNKIENLLSKVTGTILIDEFDKHLHPAWQRLFLSKLRKVFPKIQFFLTTHNPVALQSGVGGKAFILENNITELRGVDIEPNSIEVILNKYFYFDNKFFDVDTEKLLTKFYQRVEYLSIKKQNLQEDEEFREIITELSKLGEEVINIVGLELRSREWKN